MRRVLIAGCGFVGVRLAQDLRSEGDEVWCLSRSQPDLPPGSHWVCADLTRPETLRSALPKELTHLVYAASAGRSSDAQYEAVYVHGLANLLNAADLSQVRRLLFVSSTTVYHQNDGSWVDETSPTLPAHFAGIRTLQAERLAWGASVPATVLRCAGIYGPGRTRLIDSVTSGSAAFDRAHPHYTNRIHRDDVAGALRHLMSVNDPQPLYLGVDHEPAPLEEVLRFLAVKLGVALPESVPLAAPRAGNKRCRGDKLRESGYAFHYPTYREGYAEMLDA